MWPIATDVTHSMVCVCLLDVMKCYEKMAELIKMPFSGPTRRLKEPCIRWGSRSPSEAAILGLASPLKSTGNLLQCLQQKGSLNRQ